MQNSVFPFLCLVLIGISLNLVPVCGQTGKVSARPLPGYTHEPGYCLMYGECGVNVKNEKKINCLYNGKSKYLTDSNGLDLLNELCPYLFKGANNSKTCCDTNQLKTLKDNLQLPYQYLSRCPSCYRNFVALYCEMTCSPDQSRFTDVISKGKGDNKTLSIHAYNPNTTYISELGYNITNQFAYSMFNSCKHVSSPSTNAPAIKLLCGPYGESCTAHKWISYMNDINNGLAPFQIDAVFTDDPTKGQNYTTDSCDNTTYLGEGACSCNDCPASCSGPPPSPPPPPEPWIIWGLDGYYIVMIFTFGCFIFLFLNVVVWSHLCQKKKNRYSTLNDECCTVVDNSTISASDDDLGIRSANVVKPIGDGDSVSTVEKFGFFLENLLQKGFQRWGTFCARHPFIILLVGIVVIAVCGAGLKFMTITTDPVELWSAPSSQARQRKSYFDQHFGPFYRTEQLIISAPMSNSSIYEPYTDSTDPADQQHIPFGPILQLDVLHEILELQNAVVGLTADYEGETVTLNDICLKPLAPDNNNCTIMSVLNYFQNNETKLDMEVFVNSGFSLGADYHDHLMACTSGAASIDDATKLHLSCLGTFGGPVFPWVALGGYDEQNFLNASAAVITLPVVNYYNDSKKLNKALAWEAKFISFMKDYVSKDRNLSVNFSSERSIEDEINRESGADVMTIITSYLIMFAYVAIALGRFGNCGRIMIDCQLTVGLSGVLIVLCSVAMSLGIFSYAGVPLTLIIVEVVPFLALAVGVDNIFILVQHLQRDEKRQKESNEEQLGRVLGEVAPSMFLSSISETVAFFLGGLSTMPAVRTFSMFAGLAVFCDFLLQVTCFVAILSLDSRRQSAKRYDCLCCIKSDSDGEAENDGFLYILFKSYLAPSVLSEYVRPFVVVVFAALACLSGAVLHKVEIGLDQSLSMPSDSYVLGYFAGINEYLSVGAPVYFVVKEGQDYAHEEGANQVCGGTGCNNNSLVEQISYMAQMPNYSHIAYSASSWIDDYYDWLKPQSSCCRYNESALTPQFCSASVNSSLCVACRSNGEARAHARPNASEFMEFLPWFLKDNPGLICGKGGHAAYGSAVNIVGSGDKAKVGATYFMAYHSVAKTSPDFIGCLKHANEIADEISKSTKAEVFPYSVFYVYYEQYLTIVHDTIFNLGISVAAIFLVIFLIMGFDLVSALMVVGTILLILLDMFGCMYIWNIPLNAVSLVNLVMAIGISVEFCAHVTRAFALSQKQTRVARAEEALAEMGSSVFSGITLTKFVGIVILAFSKSQIFKVFYFRMYLCVVLLGAGHGLVFLPVFLSYVGPKRRKATLKHQRLVEEDYCDDGKDFGSNTTDEGQYSRLPHASTNTHQVSS